MCLFLNSYKFSKMSNNFWSVQPKNYPSLLLTCRDTFVHVFLTKYGININPTATSNKMTTLWITLWSWLFSRELKITIIIDNTPVPNANPQVTEEAGSAVATVGFARPFVSSEFLQLAQAVREQHVRQLLISKSGYVPWVLQLQLRLQWTGQPVGGSYVGALLGGPCCRLFSSFAPGEEKNT